MQEKAFGTSGQFVLEISSHCLPFLKLILMLPVRSEQVSLEASDPQMTTADLTALSCLR